MIVHKPKDRPKGSTGTVDVMWCAVLLSFSSTRAQLRFCSTCRPACFCWTTSKLPRYRPVQRYSCSSTDCSIIARRWWHGVWCSFCHHLLTGNGFLWQTSLSPSTSVDWLHWIDRVLHSCCSWLLYNCSVCLLVEMAFTMHVVLGKVLLPPLTSPSISSFPSLPLFP